MLMPSDQPSITDVPFKDRQAYAWPKGVRATWSGRGRHGFGDIAKINRVTLEITDGKFGGESMLIDKRFVYQLVRFD